MSSRPPGVKDERTPRFTARIGYRMEAEMGEFIVYETDERMFFLKKQLSGLRPVTDTHIYAPNILLTAERLDRTAEGDVLVCGRTDAGAEELAACKKLKVHRILADEKFQAANARLTAEGALGIAIEHSMLSLTDMSVLVLGFGRTGAAVCRLFDKVGAAVDVATTASPRPAGAFARRVTSASSADLSVYDVIVNTIPVKTISDDRAMTMRHDAMYIDLASTPGVNLTMLKNLGLDAEIYPALPAKCSPESAAAAMKEYILEVTA